MHEHLQTQPFSFDRTFPVPDREPSRQYRRKTDPAKLSDEIDILQREIAMLEESHAKELACARSEAFEAGRHHVLADREADLHLVSSESLAWDGLLGVAQVEAPYPQRATVQASGPSAALRTPPR